MDWSVPRNAVITVRKFSRGGGGGEGEGEQRFGAVFGMNGQ